ncbi:hypothetical protein Pelo_17907 [Pelomyxa schiedti]|nr:hypothetical protein Pelo_17907 [Pelomyxa schiedti]
MSEARVSSTTTLLNLRDLTHHGTVPWPPEVPKKSRSAEEHRGTQENMPHVHWCSVQAQALHHHMNSLLGATHDQKLSYRTEQPQHVQGPPILILYLDHPCVLSRKQMCLAFDF